MHDEKHEMKYERKDGKVHRIHTVESTAVEEHQVLNEFRGLILRRKHLLQELRNTETRLQALRPIAREIMDENAEPAADVAMGETDPPPETIAAARERVRAANVRDDTPPS